MASFCEECSKDIGFKTDFDIKKELKELKNGYVLRILCEGCGLNAIAKTDEGDILYSYFDGEDWETERRKFFH